MTAGKRKLIELRLAHEERRLIELEESLAVVSTVVATFRLGLDGLPARLTRDPARRKEIKQECDAILAAAAKKFEEFARGDVIDKESENDADD